MTAPKPLGLWLPDHKQRDCRKAGDDKKDTDLVPIHLPTVRKIGGPVLGPNRREAD
jgi:hypothetical protein